jgi:hypothetical protein
MCPHNNAANDVAQDLAGGEVGAMPKWPKAVAKITDDLDVLLAFYDFRPSTGSSYAPPIP